MASPPGYRKSANQRGGHHSAARKGKSRAYGGTLDVRLNLVEQWLSSAWTRAAMCAEAQKRWDIRPRTVDDYVAAVKARMSEEMKAGRADARERQRMRLMRIIRESTKGKRKNWFAALQAEQLLGRLEGTPYQPGDDLPKTGDAEVTFEIDLPPEEEQAEAQQEQPLPLPAKAGAA